MRAITPDLESPVNCGNSLFRNLCPPTDEAGLSWHLIRRPYLAVVERMQWTGAAWRTRLGPIVTPAEAWRLGWPYAGASRP